MATCRGWGEGVGGRGILPRRNKAAPDLSGLDSHLKALAFALKGAASGLKAVAFGLKGAASEVKAVASGLKDWL